MPRVEWTKEAVEDLQKLDKSIAKRILNKISWFSQHFDNITPEPLSGELVGTFKLRIGDWRVIYTIEIDVIVIQAIGHRKEVYK
ncbi:MAG TPA: type II toxin-antitoxin system RelE/ParE family toxin [Thermodesulfovibrionales bacterium]|nr:type II toxin-antitoxin system RelE/ParE family toxin [Thermodesulfovibrionales bacterium]